MGKGRGKGRSNIEGLDPESPRTLEACLHRGITMEELQPREENTFRRGMESADFTHRRFDFFEKRRQDKIALVKSRRADLVRKSAPHEGPGGLSTGEKRALEEAAKQKAATISPVASLSDQRAIWASVPKSFRPRMPIEEWAPTVTATEAM